MKIFTITALFTFCYFSLFGQSILGEGTSGIGVWGNSSSHWGVYGSSTSSIGVYGSSTSSIGVYGYSSTAYGVYGASASDAGVYGRSSTHIGVEGKSTNWFGVYGESTYSYGVYGVSTSDVGVFGRSGSSAAVIGLGATYDFFAQGSGVNYGASSSIRWKRNIVNIPSPLEKLNSIRGVYFDWDEAHGGKHDIGFIAEEVGQVIPEIVVYEENGVDASGMDYSKMTPLLVEAANAMRNEYLEEIAAIKKENQGLKTRLDKIERMLAGQDISQSP